MFYGSIFGMQKQKSQSAITLIALVITIVVLLILAGVTIATLSGENGLLARAKKASKDYSIAEAKEKIELAIMDLRIEQEGKSEQLTKDVLPKINTDEISVGTVESFPIQVVCSIYKFNIDENFSVTYVGEANETIVTYTTEPVGYTNSGEIKILLKAINQKGIKSIEDPTGDIITINDGKTEVAVDYKVTKNGTYLFKVVDIENNEVTKEVFIDKFDTISPLDFNIETEKSGTTVTIIANAEDGAATETSVKSGIDHYDYYANGEKKESNTLTNLIGTYEIYAIAYDKAGNSKKSNTTTISVTGPSKAVAAGFGFSTKIDTNGNLWTWGYNYHG